MKYIIKIRGEYIAGKKETLSFERACSSAAAAEILGHVASGGFKVRREAGQYKNGKLRTILTPLETQGRYEVLSLEGAGINFDEVKGWKI